MGYRLYKHINIHGAARRDAARPELTAQGEGERGGGDGRALSAPADTGAQRHVPVLPPWGPERWLRGRGEARAVDRWLRTPQRGAAPYLRPARPLRRRPTSGRAAGSARPAQPPLSEAGSSGRRRQPQPRGAPAGQRGGHRGSRIWSRSGARAVPQRRARKVPIGAPGAASLQVDAAAAGGLRGLPRPRSPHPPGPGQGLAGHSGGALSFSPFSLGTPSLRASAANPGSAGQGVESTTERLRGNRVPLCFPPQRHFLPNFCLIPLPSPLRRP